jgi:CBS domain-containing protein
VRVALRTALAGSARARGFAVSKVNEDAVLEAKGRSIYSISADASVFDALKKMADHNVGALIVLDNDKLAGPVTRNLETAVRRTVDAVPDPRVVIAVGACAASGASSGRDTPAPAASTESSLSMSTSPAVRRAQRPSSSASWSLSGASMPAACHVRGDRRRRAFVPGVGIVHVRLRDRPRGRLERRGRQRPLPKMLAWFAAGAAHRSALNVSS